MKTALIIDMPANCSNCLANHQNLKCGVAKRIVDLKERPYWCPLRPLPEELDINPVPVSFDRLSDLCNLHYAMGFNDCLDEILGEIE